MKWFKNINNLNELRTAYKKFVIMHHPDNGGLEETIKEINAEYDTLFHKIKYGYEHSDDYKNVTNRQKQTYDSVKDQKIREMVVNLSRFQGLTIELCGMWLWISGDTKKYKEELKSLGLHYASHKKCWYIHWDDYVKHGKEPSSMSYIRSKYGSTVFYETKKEAELCMKASK